jgi:hypothetical protein
MSWGKSPGGSRGRMRWRKNRALAEGTSRRMRWKPPFKEYLEGRSSRKEWQRHESWDEQLERRRAWRRQIEGDLRVCQGL